MPFPRAFVLLENLAQAVGDLRVKRPDELLPDYVFMYSSFWLRFTAFLSHN
jgi:hypothetical protein